MGREEKRNDNTGFWGRLLCCICDAVEIATEGEFPQSKSMYQPPKKLPSGAKKTEESQGTKASDDQPPRQIGTFNMTLSISIPEKQIESTTTLKTPITDKDENSQAKPRTNQTTPEPSKPSLAIPEKQIESTTTLKTPITDKDENSQAKPRTNQTTPEPSKPQDPGFSSRTPSQPQESKPA